MFSPENDQIIFQNEEAYRRSVNMFVLRYDFCGWKDLIWQFQVYIKRNYDFSDGMSSKFQFQPKSFQICPFNKHNNAILYRYDENELVIMKIWSKIQSSDQRLYKIQYINKYPQYLKSTLACLDDKVIIQTQNFIEVYDRQMIKIQEIKIQPKFQSNKCKFNQRYVFCQNYQLKQVEIFSLKTGFNFKKLKNTTFQDLLIKSIESPILFKNGSLFVIQNQNIQLQTTDNNLYLRAQNQLKSDFKIYQIQNTDTLSPLSNFWAIKTTQKFIDNIWNSSIQKTFDDQNIIMSHFQYKQVKLSDRFNNLQIKKQYSVGVKRLIISIREPEYDNQCGIFQMQSFENNKIGYSQIKSICDYIGISGISNLAQNNSFAVIYNSIYNTTIQVLSYDQKADSVKTKILVFNKQNLPNSYLLYAKDKTFFDGKYVYHMQNGLPNWNSTFSNLYSMCVPDTLFHAQVHKKIVIYSVLSNHNKFQQISQFSSYNLSLINQNLIDFLVYKQIQTQKSFIFVLFEKTLIIQQYPATNNLYFQQFFDQKSDFIKICISQNGSSIVLISASKDSIMYSVNLSKFPSNQCLFNKRMLVSDRKVRINSGLVFNNLFISYSDKQVFVHHIIPANATSEKLFSVQKTSLKQMISNFQIFYDQVDKMPKINTIKIINATSIKIIVEEIKFQQSTKYTNIYPQQIQILVKDHLVVNSRTKKIKIINQLFQRTYSVQKIANSQNEKVLNLQKQLELAEMKVKQIMSKTLLRIQQ